MTVDAEAMRHVIDEADEDRVMLDVAGAVLGLIRAGSKCDGPNGETDPDLAVDGVLMALAAILEQAPELPNQQVLRKAAESYGKRLTTYARLLRLSYEETGVHPIRAITNPLKTAASEVSHTLN